MKKHASSPRGGLLRDGFTLIELLVVIAIIAVLIGILLPALGGAIGSARTLKCQVNLRSMGTAAMTYGDDYRGTIPAFNWKPGNYDTPYADLRGASDDEFSVRFQAVSIIRDFSGNPYIPAMSGGNNWFANLWFSHLVYFDYLTGNLEEPVAACPLDAQQVERAERPISEYETSQLFRKFESSYEMAISAYTDDIPKDDIHGISQEDSHYRSFDRGPSFLASRRFSEVRYPSGKAFMFDEIDRHFAEQPDTLFLIPGARQPILFFDGSVSVRDTNDSNPGFRPLDPMSPEPSLIEVPGDEASPFPGVYRWTRGGLRGIDFGGDEVSTGQPRP